MTHPVPQIVNTAHATSWNSARSCRDKYDSAKLRSKAGPGQVVGCVLGDEPSPAGPWKQTKIWETVQSQSAQCQGNPVVASSGETQWSPIVPKWPIEVVGNGGEFQLDPPEQSSQCSGMLGINDLTSYGVTGCYLLVFVNTHTHTPEQPLHAQYIRCVTYSRYRQVHTRTHPKQPLHAQYIKHVMYNRYNTHTKVTSCALKSQGQIRFQA